MFHLRSPHKANNHLHPNLRRILPVAALLLLAFGHGLLALMAMREKSTTSDEIAHVTGGYTFNHWNDYRLHPENGLLPQRWQALPATLAGAHYPNLNDPDWRDSNVWMIGHGFFYDLGNNHEWILFMARAMNTLFGSALVILVGIWARHFYGWAGALTAAAFCAFCPTMLAHSALATSDMAMAFFLLASVSAFWWHLNNESPPILILSAVTFGLACVAKYTAVLLLPLFVLMALIRCVRSAPIVFAGHRFGPYPRRAGALACSLLIHGITAIFIIWAFCGFRYSAFNPSLPSGVFNAPWDYVLAFGGWKAAVINFCRKIHLLPESYLYGFSFVLRFAEARAAFLDGDYSVFGWVSFFPKTFLYKTPPSLLVALIATGGTAAFLIRKRGMAFFRTQLYRATPLWLLFTLYWGISLTSHLNIGHRHILPTYPMLYVGCGILGWAAFRITKQSRTEIGIATIFVIGALGWQVKIAVETYPNYLAYFSPLIGGPAEGYKHLADSSLDWGQDLPGLKKWLQFNRRPKEPVYLSYFGTGEPDYYGIDAIRMPMIYAFHRERPWYWFRPGIYALSATMLQQVYMKNRGPWTLENERQYQELRYKDVSFHLLKTNPERHPELLKDISFAQWNAAWDVYEQLRFDRLCQYLQVRRPDAMIGYSILIFRLSQEEINSAVTGSVGDLGNAIEKAMASQSR